MNEFYIYIHTKQDTGEIFYVGKGKGKRAYSKHSRSKFWNNIVDKYGYNVIIFENGLSEVEAFKLEIELIDMIGRRDLGKGTLVNLTDGGEGQTGWVPNDEYRLNMSVSTSSENNGMYGKNHSEEYKQTLSESRIGNGNPMYNRHHSNETKCKISDKQKGCKNHSSKKIVNIETGVVYGCLNDLSNEISVSSVSLSRNIRGKTKINKYPNFKFL